MSREQEDKLLASLIVMEQELEEQRARNHHLRGLLETAVDAHDCGGSVTEAWWDEARKAGGG